MHSERTYDAQKQTTKIFDEIVNSGKEDANFHVMSSQNTYNIYTFVSEHCAMATATTLGANERTSEREWMSEMTHMNKWR